MEYKIITRKIPGSTTEPEKYYATIVRPNNISLDELAKRIAEVSPVNELDTEAVLIAFTRILPEFLQKGATVELGDFGYLRVDMSSGGADTEEDFTKELIRGNKISYRPSTKVKEMMQAVKYDKAK